MWMWNEDLRHSVSQNDNNKYVIVDNDVFILYPKFVAKNELGHLNRNEMLCYLHLIKNPPILKYNYVYTGVEPCDICNENHRTRHFYSFGNCTVIRCTSCEADRKDKDVFINRKEINPCAFLNRSRSNIDITFLTDDHIVFLYRYKSQKYTFGYEMMISCNRYGYVPKLSLCIHCGRDPICINAYCKSCYNFSYELSQVYKILLFENAIDGDIFINILSYYVTLINLNISLKNILIVKNPCPKIIKEEVIESLYFSDVDYDESYDDSTEHYESITEY